MELKYNQIFLIIIGYFIIEITACCEEYCYANDTKRSQLNYLGTKTPYNNHNLEANPHFKVPDCTAVKIWMLSRDGIALPSIEEMETLSSLNSYTETIVIGNYLDRQSAPIKGPLCEDDKNLIHDWLWDEKITREYASTLTLSGSNEMKNLGIRLQKSFPKLMTKAYSSDKILFGNINTTSTEASNNAFVKGLWEGNTKYYLNTLANKFLQAYESCPEFEENVESLSDPNTELSKFKTSDIYMNLINDVSKRLGFNKELLNDVEIIKMYEMCRYDNAINISDSHWCAAFTPEQIKIMEYKEDLLSYYTSGYGFHLSSKLPCSLMVDMLNHLNRNDRIAPHVAIYFANKTTLELLITALEILKDSTHLLANNYNKIDRKWRTSKIVPYGANIIAVKYQCQMNNYKIKLFLNEKPIEIDGCNGDLCDWNIFKMKYDHFKNVDCSTAFCDLPDLQMKGSGTIITITINFLLIPFIFLLF